MNAILTWWGVSMAVSNRVVQSSTVVDPQTITTVVPVFVAIMVWVIRILIIGTLSLAMDRLLHPGAVQQQTVLQNAISASAAQVTQIQSQPVRRMNIPASLNSASIPQRPSMSRAAQPSNPRPSRFSGASEDQEHISEPQTRGSGHPEPTYHSLSMSARPSVSNGGSKENGGTNRYRRS